MDLPGGDPQTSQSFWSYDLDELFRTAAALDGLKNAVGAINPRPPGWRNDLVQLVKRFVARSLAWYTRPLRAFDASVGQSLQEIVCALGSLSTKTAVLDQLLMDVVALGERLAQSEKRNIALAESMQEQLDFLHKQVNGSAVFPNAENGRVGARVIETGSRRQVLESPRLSMDAYSGVDRTAYIIGLFGSGRLYLNDVMLRNIGRRAKYIRDTIRLHPGPTPMIYSGHATLKYVSCAQNSPEVTNQILEAVRWRFADLIFIYRHPLDSLLTNWVWWRTYRRDSRLVSGLAEVYRNTDELCDDLDRNFLEFKAFAEGNADFFLRMPGPRFLSFAEYVEETELHLESATLSLRLEDFMVDPCKEFSKIIEVMSVDPAVWRPCIASPKSKPYRYLALRQQVSQFRNFIDGLDAETAGEFRRWGMLCESLQAPRHPGASHIGSLDRRDCRRPSKVYAVQ